MRRTTPSQPFTPLLIIYIYDKLTILDVKLMFFSRSHVFFTLKPIELFASCLCPLLYIFLYLITF